MFWASPRRGTDARTHGGIISFELSPLKRCMRINSNKGCPRVTEWLRVESEPGEEGRERNMRQGGQSEVREWKVYGFRWEVLIFGDFTNDFSWEVLKFTISTYHFMMCFEHLTKNYQFYAVFWGRRELSTVKYIDDFLKFQIVWCKSIGFELPRGGGRTHAARTDGRTEE